jgi:hypothetical protein
MALACVLAVSCDLNPQPLPPLAAGPGGEDAGSAGSSSGSSSSGGFSSGDSSGSASGSGTIPVDGNDAGVPATVSDGGTEPDANTNAPHDAGEADGGSDGGGLDAGDAGPGDGRDAEAPDGSTDGAADGSMVDAYVPDASSEQ